MGKIQALFSCIFAIVILSPSAWPCTAFSVSGGGATAVMAKNLDWSSGQGMIFINKRMSGRPARWSVAKSL